MDVSPNKKFIILIGLTCIGIIVYYLLAAYDLLPIIQDGKQIQQYIESTGLFGPITIILLMTLAILVSPLPSAPIAIAAGAIYGHTWGTFYVLIGSLSGAISAFLISRYLGYEYIQNLAKNYFPIKFTSSQNALLGIVFITRLMPFLSFDIISYAAGLTPMRLWRFVVATLFGIAPASFFLAHVGSEMATVEWSRIAMAILLLSLIMVVSVLIQLFRNKMLNKKR